MGYIHIQGKELEDSVEIYYVIHLGTASRGRLPRKSDENEVLVWVAILDLLVVNILT